MKRTTGVKYAAAALAGTAVLAACGTESGSGGGSGSVGGDVDIAGIRWIPRTVTVDGKDYALPSGDDFRLDEAHVTFKPGTAKPDEGGGESGGTVGCNDFGADVEVDGDTVTVSDLAQTEIGCPGPVQEFEERFVGVFHGDLKAEIDKDGTTKTLTLTRANGDSITLAEGAAATTPPLTGTRWTIDTLLSGEGDDGSASSLPEGAKAHLTLAADGTASGALGCNTFRGKATVKDGTIEFGPLATTRMVCSGPVMKTERELADILSGKVSYQRKDNTLTLTAASGAGLAARAEQAAGSAAK